MGTVARSRLVLALLCAVGAAACTQVRPRPVEVAARPPSPPPRPRERVELGRWVRVEKLARQLTVYDDVRPIRTYPIVLGRDPVGAKLYEGDRRTPEGEYRIAAKYPHDRWSRFLLLDYPTPMNERLYRWSRSLGLIPAAAPGPGGEVGIHGTADESRNTRGENWTLGCISLHNRDVEELYTLVDVGTRVVIER